MQAQGSFGRLVLVEENTFKTAPELVVENCEDAWDEYTASGVTSEIDASDKKVGTNSLKLTMTETPAVEILATEVISIASLAAYTHISAWVKSSVALAAGDLQLLLDETAQCASPLETLNIPALSANTWTQIRLTLANPSTDLLLISIGIKQAVDKGAFVFHIDDIRAIRGGVYLPFKSESLRMSRNLITSNIIRSTRNPNMPSRGRREVAGDITTELNPWMGLIFKHLLGDYSVAGGGPYTHTFKIGNLPIGLQIEKQFSDIEKYLLYNGCKIGSLGITITDEGPLELRLGLMGAKEAITTLPFDGAPTDFGHVPFDGFEVVINRGGSPLGIGTKVDFSVDNALDGSVFVIDATGERYSLPAGIVKANGNLTALFEDLTLYELAVNHTETTLQIVLTKGTGAGTAGNEKLTFNFDEVIFKPQAPVISGPAGVLVELPFEAYYDNDADASAIWIELKNAQALLC
jgi:hypothetical protein